MTKVRTIMFNVSDQLDNLRIVSTKKLNSPVSLRSMLPVTNKAAETVAVGRKQIQSCLTGEDGRLVVIVGPCSIHDPIAALEYATKLVALQKKYEERLLIVMRVYFEKPRTTTGWKGLINTPDLFGPSDSETGRYVARKLMIGINELGIPVATEVLDPLNPPFFSDLIAWGAIGARTIESQTHREIASGLSFPVGMKNGTGGSVEIAVNAMVAAKSPHTFIGIDEFAQLSELRSIGNPYTQLILRGGSRGPNYSAESVSRSVTMLRQHDLCPRIIVDSSHANAEGDFRNQARVLSEVLQLRRSDSAYSVGGIMIESNLNSGNQKITNREELKYGVSVTDGCVGWEQTEEILEKVFLLSV